MIHHIIVDPNVFNSMKSGGRRFKKKDTIFRERDIVIFFCYANKESTGESLITKIERLLPTPEHGPSKDFREFEFSLLHTETQLKMFGA